MKQASRKCDFACGNACTVRDTLARDQIIIGVRSDEIRKHALKNEWNLEDLIKNGRQLEAASKGVQKLKHSSHSQAGTSSESNVNRTRRPGKYSNKPNKNQQHDKKKIYKLIIATGSNSRETFIKTGRQIVTFQI